MSGEELCWPPESLERVLAFGGTWGVIRPGIVLGGPLWAPESHRLLRGSAEIPVPHPSSPAHWKTLSIKGPKLSAHIRKNISARKHNSRVTGELLGHKTMAMTDWYVEKATPPLRERRAVAKLHRNVPALAGGRIVPLSSQMLPTALPTRT
jgi:hypothetical protein